MGEIGRRIEWSAARLIDRYANPSEFSTSVIPEFLQENIRDFARAEHCWRPMPINLGLSSQVSFPKRAALVRDDR